MILSAVNAWYAPLLTLNLHNVRLAQPVGVELLPLVLLALQYNPAQVI